MHELTDIFNIEYANYVAFGLGPNEHCQGFFVCTGASPSKGLGFWTLPEIVTNPEYILLGLWDDFGGYVMCVESGHTKYYELKEFYISILDEESWIEYQKWIEYQNWHPLESNTNQCKRK